MTDKEIIIDGVNVARCVFLDDYSKSMCNGFRADNSGFHQGHCIQNPNCYYKRLQRKEQECEELKEKYQEYVKTHHYNNAEFKQERDSLIQEIQYKNRYKQALEKIEEYVKSQLDANGNDVYSMDKTAIHKFLTILNEVKDAD